MFEFVNVYLKLVFLGCKIIVDFNKLEFEFVVDELFFFIRLSEFGERRRKVFYFWAGCVFWIKKVRR